MAIIAFVKISDTGTGFRLDPEFYTAPGAVTRNALAETGIPFDSYFERIVHPPEFVRRYLESPGRRFLRAQNVRPGRIEDREPVYVDEDVYRQCAEAVVINGDLLLVRTGANLADLARVTPEWEGALVSSHTLRLIPRQGAPICALEAFFCSPTGRGLLLGLRSGGTHGQINASGLGQQKLPDLTPLEPRISELAEEIRGLRLSSAESFAKAEALMRTTLSLDEIDLRSSLTYERRLSELFKSRRFGAEYFMPVKSRALQALSKGPNEPIAAHFQVIKESFDPRTAASREVRNFDLSDALEPFFDDSHPLVETGTLGSSKRKFRHGDLVISRLRSYLREIAVVRCSDAEVCVGSSEFVVLRAMPGDISPSLLLIYLRSEIVQKVLEWSQDGSNHPRFDDDDLLAIPIPKRLIDVQDRIDLLVEESTRSNQAARNLFKQSISIIESSLFG